MSWSVSLIGTPAGINRELDAYGETLSDQSKTEFLEAKPHLQGLVAQAVGQNVKLNANGHATFTNGDKTYGAVSVVLECMYNAKWCE